MSYNYDSIVQAEHDSIRAFVQKAAEKGVFTGQDVLDFGCGRQPYRKIVEAEGYYYGYDLVSFPGSLASRDFFQPDTFNREYGAVLCNQVIQYVPEPLETLRILRGLLLEYGTLVLTWPTNWDEIQDFDYWRFTEAGMRLLLARAGFQEVESHRRAVVSLNGFNFPLGYGAFAWK